MFLSQNSAIYFYEREMASSVYQGEQNELCSVKWAISKIMTFMDFAITWSLKMSTSQKRGPYFRNQVQKY